MDDGFIELIMVSDSFFGTFVMWDNGVAHGPIVYIFHTILTVSMEIDSECPSPHNLEGSGNR
jgi:hypothetical protein